jgi:prophage tail gpP-like protein
MNDFVNTIEGLLPNVQPDPANQVSIIIGNSASGMSGWENVSITRSAEAFPNSFTVTASDQYSNDPTRAATFPTGPGEKCKVMIGNDLVITGYIDRYVTNIGPESHSITISGRGLCEDLVDCSADLVNTPGMQGATITASNAEDLAQKLCVPFGLKAKCIPNDKGRKLLPFTIWLSETPYEIIERVCGYTAFLAYEDETGQLILDRVGTNKMASGFTMPGNIEGASSSLSIDQRYSNYTVVFNSVAQFNELSPVINNRGFASDKKMPRYRPLIIVSAQYDPDRNHDLSQERANWEMARRYGRSQAIRLTCDGWRDTAGKLWQPNYLADINAPALKITNKQWVIGTVTFRKDMSGTHADVVLMPPDAFQPQPQPLFMWDMELMQSNPSSQAQAAVPPAPQGPGGLLGRV